MSRSRRSRGRRSTNARLARLFGLGKVDPPDEDDWDFCEVLDDEEPEPEPGDFWFDRDDEGR